MKNRPYTLTIAGFDPSGGAGLMADVKTFESLKCYGLAVQTANTEQNDIKLIACQWIDISIIQGQLELLFERFDIDVVKIGIVKNWEVLNKIVDILFEKNNSIKIILDPILRSSSDFKFHNQPLIEASVNENCFEEVLKKIYLLTPNYQEIEKLYTDRSIEETIKHISGVTNLFLKGGHRKEAIGKDELFTSTGKHFILNPKEEKVFSEKHGSGCVLSSAITAYLAHGFPLLKSCFRAKRYTEKVLSSNKSLLGYHKM